MRYPMVEKILAEAELESEAIIAAKPDLKVGQKVNIGNQGPGKVIKIDAMNFGGVAYEMVTIRLESGLIVKFPKSEAKKYLT